ncbi:DUF2937 family protein [Alteromonas sp. A081]|uniref:DUF2937 family protein n=1 Tax=Alteromonas sp. A081 TaxID=3410269 RepID=UPI003B9853D0
MIMRVLDKVVFAVLFIIALQVPILADHYRQYLNGYYEAIRDEVTLSSELAKQHGFSSVKAMLDSLQQNDEALVRDNASQKAQRFSMIDSLEQGMRTLEYGHYFEKLAYIASPEQFSTLKKVVDKFRPSIPLTPTSIIFSLVTAILLNLLIWTPHFCYCQAKKLKKTSKTFSYK